jgi:hypothetical protein
MPTDASPSSEAPASTPAETPSAVAPVETPALIPGSRADIYARYAASIAPQVVEEAVAPPVVAEAPLVALSPVVPVETAAPSPAPVVVDPSIAVLARITSQLEALEARETARNAPPPPPPAPEVEPAFLVKLRDGDIKGAETAMRDSILAQIKAELKPAPDASAIAAQVRETNRLEADLGSFLSTLRTTNPEIVPMESYIGAAVQAKVSAAQSSGLITTPSSYAEFYKKTCTEEYAAARRILQVSRAEGKLEANTVASVVLASTPLAPNPVSSDRGIPLPPPGAPNISAGSYLEKRAAMAERTKGLSG